MKFLCKDKHAECKLKLSVELDTLQGKYSSLIWRLLAHLNAINTSVSCSYHQDALWNLENHVNKLDKEVADKLEYVKIKKMVKEALKEVKP
jgi:hypothetical protein